MSRSPALEDRRRPHGYVACVRCSCEGHFVRHAGHIVSALPEAPPAEFSATASRSDFSKRSARPCACEDAKRACEHQSCAWQRSTDRGGSRLSCVQDDWKHLGRASQQLGDEAELALSVACMSDWSRTLGNASPAAGRCVLSLCEPLEVPG